MRMIELIEKKKQNEALSKEEISFIINGYVNKQIPDYQVSAFLMAVYFNGMNNEEIFYLTDAMLHSGEVIDLSKIKGIKVDKHSTGGVGDKTSLVVGPLAASFGVKMAKMSGRGLGHTGGTLDKLESIPGFKIEIDSDHFFKQVNEIGVSIIGQSADITPADKLLYALRDVTSTVDSIPLIASSIMSKKLASGADSIVLDVKVGSGAFMKDVSTATKLAETMVELGKIANKPTIATLTDMEQPLGNAIGNSIEVIEAIETLKGNGPKDFTDLCVAFTAEILCVSKKANNMEEATKMVLEAIHNGQGVEKFKEMISWQGGNPEVINDYSLFPTSEEVIDFAYEGDEEVYISSIDALKIGEAAMLLGAGRLTKEEAIDPSVGVYLHKKVGDKLSPNEVLFSVYTNNKSTEEAIELILEAYDMSKEEVKVPPIILKTVK